MDIILKDKYISILDLLSVSLGIDVCLAGGAVRDLLHDKTAKDLDFEILNHDRSGCVEKYVEGIEEALDSIGAEHIKSYTAYEGSSLDAHVDVVVKFTLYGFTCDLILRDVWPSSIEQLVLLYDMSINQVVLYKGRIHVLGNLKDGFVRPTGKMISKERLARITSKYPAYDYSMLYDFIY